MTVSEIRIVCVLLRLAPCGNRLDARYRTLLSSAGDLRNPQRSICPICPEQLWVVLEVLLTHDVRDQACVILRESPRGRPVITAARVTRLPLITLLLLQAVVDFAFVHVTLSDQAAARGVRVAAAVREMLGVSADASGVSVGSALAAAVAVLPACRATGGVETGEGAVGESAQAAAAAASKRQPSRRRSEAQGRLVRGAGARKPRGGGGGGVEASPYRPFLRA